MTSRELVVRVCVAGAGGIGMAYAARLSNTSGPSRSLILMTRRVDAREAALAGLTVERPQQAPAKHSVTACLGDEIESASQDVVILTTKTFDNEAILPTIARILSSSGACLSVQNGVANLDLMRTVLGDHRAFQGATGVGATALGPGRVLETSSHATWIPTSMPHAAPLAAWMDEAGLNPIVIDGTERVQWHKAAIGSLSGGIAVLLDLPFGRVVSRPAVRSVLRAMLREVAAVAAACGVTLDLAEEEAEQERMFDSVPPEAMTSIYTDYRARRRTELTEQFEPILTLAAAHAVAVPVLSTVYALTREKFALEAST